MSNRRICWLLFAILFALLSACGGTTNPDDGSGNSSGGNSAGGNTGGGGGTPAQQVVQFGSFDANGNFNQGAIATDRSTLKAGTSANLTVSLIDQDGKPVTTATDIFFSSPCIGSGLADIEPPVAANANGRITAKYTARGCSGTDPVTAQTSIDGNSLTATVNLQTQQAPLGSIQFDGASNALIGVQGSGALPEQSTLSFLVTNQSGGPAPNRQVNFSLNTTVGGITLSNMQDTTDAQGRVSTTVNSGTQATTVRVTASAMRDSGVGTTAQSNGVAITTGVPDNDSLSLSAESLNIEGLDRDGETTAVTVRAADRFNNPVPDGTAISFTTEGGSIPGSCSTTNGACSVQFTSQNPRPGDGRVTILATAIGEESFTDSNPSNGRFDSGEFFVDLPEAFRDDNENGRRDSNEPFIDFNSDGNYSPGSGNFTGLLCNSPNVCDSANSLNVRDDLVIVLSGSSLNVTIDPAAIDLNGGPQMVQVSVSDINGQVPPAGTTVSATASQGNIDGESNFTVRSTKNEGPVQFQVRLEPENQNGDGLFRIVATTPSGVISRASANVDQTP